MRDTAILLKQLEYLYTARGSGQTLEFPLNKPPESGEGDGSETMLDKLRKDIVFLLESRLYSDIKISITGVFSRGTESTTATFSSHRFVLASRSPYFHESLKSSSNAAKPIVEATAVSEEKEILTVTLPSPPFTPDSLRFTLGYMYAGTLSFSHRTFDLKTAFEIMRSATYLRIQPLYDEIQARIVQEMMHGLFDAFLGSYEYERTTAGKWGTGGCVCQQCARRAPRVLMFAIAEDVKNRPLTRGAGRALVATYGEGWCTSEFSKLPEEIKLQLVKMLAERTIPTNVFPLLFAAHQALRRLSTISGSWLGGVKELVLSVRKTIDEVLCNQVEECFEQPEWVEIMAGFDDADKIEWVEIMAEGEVGFDSADKVDWVMESIERGLSELNAPFVYQVGDLAYLGGLSLTNDHRLLFPPSS